MSSREDSGAYLKPVSSEIPVAAGKPKRIIIVEHETLFAEVWRTLLLTRYGPAITVEIYQDPLKALEVIGPDVSLLMVDLELPLFGGRKMFELAKERGVAPRRMVILSTRDANELHQLFPDGCCLAVINKHEPNQQNAFLMILDSIVKRH
jgi:DNA-binding LytR/AlgR family response regulator